MAARIAEALADAPDTGNLDLVDRGDLVFVVSLALQSKERTPEQQAALVRTARLLDNPFVAWSAEAVLSHERQVRS